MALEPRAEWRSDPHSEREIVEERRRWRLRRRTFQAFVLATFAGPFVLGSVLAGGLPPVSVGIGLAAWIALGLLALARSARAAETSARNRRTHVDEVQAVSGWAVELTVLQGATPTGHDHGVVWLEDDRLFFLGARTSFGLFSSPVAPNARDRLAFARETAPLILPLNAGTAAGEVAVRLRPLPLDEDSGSLQDVARLGWLVRSWLAQGVEGTGQLPPLAIGSDAPSPGSLLARAVGSTLLWITLLPFVTALPIALLATSMMLAILLLLLTLTLPLVWREFGDPIGRWHAWRDRRRLDRADLLRRRTE